ncbi:EAL domain-containing protein [Vibrio sp. Of7-15]|uniref:EAL domain-containing protein n=1 Tax=Vibrio sp. Of7-15 TaxID=2724879 RepID=UPI001EF16E59|nr:EAL domain-containing protein [Vibrio sp. Of7-15]MCG7495538.1 EAL domain-containing protein [Vibrio sp. Of7-15]
MNNIQEYLMERSDGSSCIQYQHFTLTSAFQPIFTRNNQIFGHEALLRVYDHSCSATVAPNHFLSASYLSSDELMMIDQWCRVLHMKNFVRFVRGGALFLNVSPASALALLSPRAVNDLDPSYIRLVGLDSTPLYIEVLEHDCSSEEELSSVVQNIRSEGCQLAIDDYGSGASLEDRARQIKPNLIKIDQSLIKQYMLGEPSGLLDAIAISEQLESQVLVEGIETNLEYEAMLELNIDYMQGFHLGRPTKVSQFAKASVSYDFSIES